MGRRVLFVLIACAAMLSAVSCARMPARQTAAEAGAPRIVIDAGHGQPDGGATGSTLGSIEEELNLSIAKKLERLLTEDGWDVIMTRENAEQIAAGKRADMRRRREIISQSGQRLTVSIHQNFYAGSGTAGGPQVFYSAGSREGQRLAECLQSALNNALDPGAPRKAAEGDYYIVKSGSSPCVIVECGFLSDPAEEAQLCRSQYQVRIAKAIAEGIAEYTEE